MSRNRRSPIVSKIGSPLPPLRRPFAVLIDADESDWRLHCEVLELARQLVLAGCRFFVCFGRKSEIVHDLLDDILIEENLLEVVTTFHDEESARDVMSFFLGSTPSEFIDRLVFVNDMNRWELVINSVRF